jgi:hypothetical protein
VLLVQLHLFRFLFWPVTAPRLLGQDAIKGISAMFHYFRLLWLVQPDVTVAVINPGPYGMAGLSNIHPQGSGKFSGLATIAKPYHSNERSGLSPGLRNTKNVESFFFANNCFL